MADLTDDEKEAMASLIVEEADRLGYEVQAYSGRRMKGEQCLAVVTPNPVGFAYELGNAAGQHGIVLDDDIWWDQMGRDYVVYWPDLPPIVITDD